MGLFSFFKNELYFFLLVEVEDNSEAIYFMSKDTSIQPDDLVLVSIGNENKVGKVIKTCMYSKNKAPRDVNKTGYIISKLDKESIEEMVSESKNDEPQEPVNQPEEASNEEIYDSLDDGTVLQKGLHYKGTDSNPFEHLILCDQDVEVAELNKRTIYIDSGSFVTCKKLKTIILNESLKHVDENSIIGCEDLQFNEYENSIYLGTKENPYFLLVEGCYKYSDEQQTNPTIHNKCVIIGPKAFRWNSAITEIFIPDSVTSIGRSAFNACKSLLRVSGGTNVEEINDWAFGACLSLREFNFSKSLKTIGGSAFSHTRLKNVILSSGLQFIGDFAFDECRLDELSIPNTVTYIGSCFLAGGSADKITMSTNLNSYSCFSQSSVLDEDEQYKVFGNGKYMRSEDNEYAILIEKKDSSKPLTLHEDTEVILDIKDVVQKDGTIKLGKRVKKMQVWWGYRSIEAPKLEIIIDKDNDYLVVKDSVLYSKNLKELVLYYKVGNEVFEMPDTVETCGKGAFECKKEKQSLRKIILSKNLKTIGYDGLPDGIEEIVIPEELKEIDCSQFKCTGIIKFPKHVRKLFGRLDCEKTRKVILPEVIEEIDDFSISGRPTETNSHQGNIYIGSENNPYLLLLLSNRYSSQITLHENTKFVSGSAFRDSAIADLDLTNVRVAGKLNLYNNESIRSIKINHAELSNMCFSGCKSLRTVKLVGIDTIPDACFKECSSLTTVEVDETLRRIDSYAFEDCATLKQIELPESVTQIGAWAFAKCGFEEFRFPRGVDELYFFALENCLNLREIKLTRGVKVIDVRVFGESFRKNYQIRYEGTEADWNHVRLIGNEYTRNQFYSTVTCTFEK